MAEEQRGHVVPNQPISAQMWNRTQDDITRLSKQNIGHGKNTSSFAGGGTADSVQIPRLKWVRLTLAIAPDDQTGGDPSGDTDTYRPLCNAVELVRDSTHNAWVDGDEQFVVYNPYQNTNLVPHQRLVISYDPASERWAPFVPGSNLEAVVLVNSTTQDAQGFQDGSIMTWDGVTNLLSSVENVSLLDFNG